MVSSAPPGLLRDGLSACVRLTDLGLGQLRDGGRAEQVSRQQPGGVPAAFRRCGRWRTRGCCRTCPRRSSFVGRQAELAAVRALVSGSRLVTLTGAGGAGKTRLGLQVAAALLDEAGDGVWFADLATLRDPDLVAVTVADVLGVRRSRAARWPTGWRRWTGGAYWCCWTTASK